MSIREKCVFEGSLKFERSLPSKYRNFVALVGGNDHPF